MVCGEKSLPRAYSASTPHRPLPVCPRLTLDPLCFPFMKRCLSPSLPPSLRPCQGILNKCSLSSSRAFSCLFPFLPMQALGCMCPEDNQQSVSGHALPPRMCAHEQLSDVARGQSGDRPENSSFLWLFEGTSKVTDAFAVAELEVTELRCASMKLMKCFLSGDAVKTRH